MRDTAGGATAPAATLKNFRRAAKRLLTPSSVVTRPDFT